jgi:hypothetical protein
MNKYLNFIYKHHDYPLYGKYQIISISQFINLYIERHPKIARYKEVIENIVKSKHERLLIARSMKKQSDLVIAPVDPEDKRSYHLVKYPNFYMELGKGNVGEFIKRFGLPLNNPVESWGLNEHEISLCFNFVDIVEHDIRLYHKICVNHIRMNSQDINTPWGDEDYLHKILNNNPWCEIDIFNDPDTDQFNSELTLRAKHDCLIGTAFIQIVDANITWAEIRKCDYCGHFFHVTHELQHFCPAPPFRRRSICEMAYNNRLKKALRLYQSGQTLEQIDKQVDHVPIERIKEFISRQEEKVNGRARG